MGRLLSLDQIEKGKQLRESLGKLNSLKKRIDKILVTEEEGQKDFDLSLEPNKEEVVMNINGLEYYEDESFTVDRKKRKLQWNGAFDISPKLNISTEDHRKSPEAQYTGITCYSQAVRIQYLSDEAYDGLLDPDCVGMFQDDQDLREAPELNLERIRSAKNMFAGCGSLTTVPEYSFSNVQDMTGMFSECRSLVTAVQLDTQNVVTMDGTFAGCSSLTSVPKLDTSNVVVMNNLFKNCWTLNTAPILDTHKAKSMSNMFNACSNLRTIPAVDTSNVQNMQDMFRYCYGLVTIGELDLANIDGEYHMPEFYDCSSLENIMFKPNTIHYSISFHNNSRLTKASLLSILNGLGVPKMKQPVLTLNYNSKALLSADELRIAADKGWTVQ